MIKIIEGGKVELHSIACACKGSGFIRVPKEGMYAMDCISGPTVEITFEKWTELGRPKNTEEYLERLKA